MWACMNGFSSYQFFCLQPCPRRSGQESSNLELGQPGGGFCYKPEGSPRVAEKTEIFFLKKSGSLKLLKITVTTLVASRKELPQNILWLLGVAGNTAKPALVSLQQNYGRGIGVDWEARRSLGKVPPPSTVMSLVGGRLART